MNAGEILNFNASRKLVVQYKKFLDLLADLHADSESHALKLGEALEEIEGKLGAADVKVSLVQHARQAHWFDEDKFARVRKQVLDFGNDLRRELDAEFSAYSIDFKRHDN